MTSFADIKKFSISPHYFLPFPTKCCKCKILVTVLKMSKCVGSSSPVISSLWLPLCKTLHPPLHRFAEGYYTGLWVRELICRVKQLITTKTRCIDAHAHNVCFPLYEVWESPKRGSDPQEPPPLIGHCKNIIGHNTTVQRRRNGHSVASL